jgi:hypothetical protein
MKKEFDIKIKEDKKINEKGLKYKLYINGCYFDYFILKDNKVITDLYTDIRKIFNISNENRYNEYIKLLDKYLEEPKILYYINNDNIVCDCDNDFIYFNHESKWYVHTKNEEIVCLKCRDNEYKTNTLYKVVSKTELDILFTPIYED